MKVTKDNSHEIFEIENALENTSLSEDGCIYMDFALGKIHDDLGKYEEAFEYYQRANKQERAKHTFHPKDHHEFISKIIKCFGKDFIRSSHDWSNPSQKPVFIVGMPRSGTSLVEQVISSHPNAIGGGEIGFLFEYEKTLVSETRANTYPDYMEWFDRQDADAVADSYLKLIENLSQKNEQCLRVTDKMPHNFLYLGLLHSIFPVARFIHCQRNPLDTCLSIYFQKFTLGHSYSYDLSEIGVSFAEYTRLMDHWDNVLPGVVHNIQYEDLIYKHEDSARRLIDFCGLEWHSKCLEFHKSSRPVLTSSNWQVRQPVYKSSLDRWKNYDAFLDPLKKILKTNRVLV
jgi:tetratricopeptide (TPR) repeat protein